MSNTGHITPRKRPPKKIWIVIDGIDGTGKTTIRMKATAELSALGYNVSTFKVPHFTWAEQNFEMSAGKDNELIIDKHTFIANHHLENVMISEWFKKYDILISQRFWLAQFAHRRMAEWMKNPVQVDYDEFDRKEAEDLGMTSLRKPDYIILIDLPDGEIGYNRLKAFDRLNDKVETRNGITLECKEYHDVYAKVQAGVPPFDYLKNIPIFRVDGNRPLIKVMDECLTIIKNKILKLEMRRKK